MQLNLLEFKLLLVPGIGPSNFYKIKNTLKSDISEIFLKDAGLLKNLKLPKLISSFLMKDDGSLDSKLETELNYIEKHKIKIIGIDDKDYPESLKNIYQPPPFLFAKGDVSKLNNKAFGIVGSREPSRYGEDIARKISKELALNGIIIVSGLARGIDACAHEAALEKGDTIAVIGSGFRYVYPAENKKLYEKILEKDLIVTEFLFDVPPDRANFPKRNRIISGLSKGVLIVEANDKSGSLITASHALDQGKEVFAIPGEITNPKAFGTNKLIKDGAKIVLDVEDILDEVFNVPKVVHSKDSAFLDKLGIIELLDSTDRKIFDFIQTKRLIQFEELLLECDINLNTAMSVLLTLQLKNLVKELPGKFYCIDN